MNLKNMILRERRLIQKSDYCVTPFLQISRTDTHTWSPVNRFHEGIWFLRPPRHGPPPQRVHRQGPTGKAEDWAGGAGSAANPSCRSRGPRKQRRPPATQPPTTGPGSGSPPTCASCTHPCPCPAPPPGLCQGPPPSGPWSLRGALRGG